MSKKIIRGSGGGGSPPPPPQPTRTPDTLHSRQFATFLDLLSEGEIEGFATASKEGRTKGTSAYNNAALKDVFLNDTPVSKLLLILLIQLQQILIFKTLHLIQDLAQQTKQKLRV